MVLTVSAMLPWFLVVEKSGAPPRFRTIMSYNDEEDCNTPRVNWFSNPDVEYNDQVTGEDDTNCAQTIKDNMVRFLKTTSYVSQVLSRRDVVYHSLHQLC